MKANDGRQNAPGNSDARADNDPFIEPLEAAGYKQTGIPKTNFNTLSEHPEIVIRANEPRQGVSHEEVDATRLEALKARQAYETLSSYGIPIPRFQEVIGATEGNEAHRLLMVTEVVHGLSVDDFLQQHELTPDLQSKIEKTASAVAKYFGDSARMNTPHLEDLSIRQFMVGVTDSDPEDRIYMVDLDQKVREDPPEQTYYIGLWGVYGMISKIETATGTQLNDARDFLKQEIDSVYEDLKGPNPESGRDQQLATYHETLARLLTE